MKILILSFYYSPDLCAGSFRCTALVNQLLEIAPPDVKIEVLTTLPQRYSTYKITADEIEHCSDRLTLRRFRLPTHASGMVDQAKAFFFYAKQVQNWVKSQKYDLVFATSSRLMTASLGAVIASSKKIPLYLDIRDLFVDTLNDLLPARLSRVLKPGLSWIEKNTFRQAKILNIVSGGFEEYIKKRAPRVTIRQFTNGIDSDFLSFDSNQYQQSNASKNKNIITVVYAGNLGEGQGLHRIIPILAKQLEHQVQWIVIGDGGRKKLLEQCLIAQQCTNVRLLPPMSRSELNQYYQAADVLFLHLNDVPAFKRVLPSKLFEYAATGKPIWAGLAGYSADFVRNEIINAVVFNPCCEQQALQVLNELNLEHSLRDNFIEKYRREKIMKIMAADIVSLVD